MLRCWWEVSFFYLHAVACGGRDATFALFFLSSWTAKTTCILYTSISSMRIFSDSNSYLICTANQCQRVLVFGSQLRVILYLTSSYDFKECFFNASCIE